MNAFLKFQEQLETSILESSHSECFTEICFEHIDLFHQYLANEFNYKQFAQRTARARNPLYQVDDMISYIALYGLAHYQRLRTLFKNHELPNKSIEKLSIVDYGCGQGIGTLAYLEHWLENGNCDAVQHIDVILIEPSALALKRAIYWVEKKSKQYDLKIKITAHNSHFDDLDLSILDQAGSYIIHIFSNILDIYSAGSYSMHKLIQLLRHNNTQQYIFAVSPAFYGGQIGFEYMHQFLQPNVVLKNESRLVFIDEYHAQSSRMRRRYTSARFYAAEF